MSDAVPQQATGRLHKAEFIALVAMNFAMVAFSIDAMLPALPEIAAEISPGDPNRAQLVLTSFVLGMGLGTFFTGPLSDTFGRKRVIVAATVLYLIGAALAARATSLEGMVAARILQGLGVAGPRVVTLAIVRDLYAGRQMAQIMSYAMMVFTLVPAIAPAMGAVIMEASGWRSIFVAFIIFAIVAVGWMMIRQPETLLREARRPFRAGTLIAAVRTCFSHRVFVLSTLAQILSFGMLFGCLSSTQQIFQITYDRGDSFPKWFAVIALVAGLASILNARLVITLGMRRMILVGFGGQIVLSALVVMSGAAGAVPFALYMVWTTSVFFMAGLVIGNLNALAMEPVGHIAGLAASVIGAVATVMAVAVAVPIGLAFDGTPLPLAISVLVLSAMGFGVVRVGMPVR